MVKLEREFNEVLLARYEQWKEIGYKAVYFKRMLTPTDPIYKTPVGTVKHLIGKTLNEKSGFERLKKAGKLDWTIEALLADQKWHPLFEHWELDRAKRRIEGAGD